MVKAKRYYKHMLTLFFTIAVWSCFYYVPYFATISWFSFKQAFLSACIINVWSLLLSLGLYRHQNLRLTRWVKRLMPLTFVIPSLLVVLMMITLFGQHSFVRNVLTPWFDLKLYGMVGIILSHIFFYLPYTTNQYLFYCETIPEHHWKFSKLQNWHGLQEWLCVIYPILKPGILRLFCLIFILCLSSFTVIMSFGGGPQATTYSLAIYHILIFKNDWIEAVSLMAYSVLLSIVCSKILKKLCPLPSRQRFQKTSSKEHLYQPHRRLALRTHTLIICISGIFILAPLSAYCYQILHVTSLTFLLRADFLDALISSILCGIASCLCVVILSIFVISLALTTPSRSLNRFLDAHDYLFAVPGFVVSSILFIVFWNWLDIQGTAFVMMVITNALIAFPILFFNLRPRLIDLHARHNKTLQHLNLPILVVMHRIVIPSLHRELRLVGILSFLIALGDLRGSIFASTSDVPSIAGYIYDCIARYNLDEAYAASMILLGLIIAVFIISQRISNHAQS